MVPGEKFSTTMSAQSISGSITSRQRGCFMLIRSPCLEVFMCMNQGLSSKLPGLEAATCTSMRLRQGRVEDSTLITCAP